MPDPYHPYQQYQNQYQDPRFGQSHDEGTIEEHIHRSVNKRVDHSRTPGQPGDRGRLLIATSATALVAVVAAAVTLAMFLVYKGSAETQLSECLINGPMSRGGGAVPGWCPWRVC